MGVAVALVLFTLGSLFAIYEGVQKLLHPYGLVDPKWAIGILLVGIVVEGFSFRTAIVESRPLGTRHVVEFVRHSKNPELPVVLLEDLGALLGLVALVAVVLAGDARFDALGSVAIGVLLGVIAIVLAIEMRSSCSARRPLDHQEGIRHAILGSPHVRRSSTCAPSTSGPTAARGRQGGLRRRPRLQGALDAIDDVESAIRATLPHSAVIYIELDVYDPSEDTRLGEEASDAAPSPTRSRRRRPTWR